MISLVFERTAQNTKCASGSVGGARPCQGRGRGFESRLALEEKNSSSERMGYFFVRTPWPVLERFEVYAPLRSAQNRGPPDLVRPVSRKVCVFPKGGKCGIMYVEQLET